ncbi:MAG: hypothetical protein FJ090_21510 [Deltaproteobacteria bacterium]|nr:hypothetical protein [Deltaproteobacteria bacterium]
MAGLRRLDDGLWVVDHRDFSVGGLRLGTRSTLVRRPVGSLVLVSPGPLAETDLAEIRGLGEVSDVVVPNQLHNLFCVAAAAAFPEAKVYAVPTIRAKQPRLRIDEELGATVPGGLADTFEMLPLEGARRVDERLLFHASTRTLVGVDVAFNIRNATGLLRFAMWLNDGNDKLCMTRLGKSQYLDDHRAAARSVDRACDAFDFDRLVVSHGEVYEGGAREALREAYAFGRG